MKTNKLFAGTALALLLSTGLAAAANIDTNTARMQAMDKITGRVSEIDVPVDGEVQFGSFSIVVRKCVTRSPEETPENTAFVDVVDNYNPEKPVNIFKGWMMSSTPALNAVEHPIYDVWLLKCYNTDTKGKKLLTPDELAKRDNVPMQLTESALTEADNKTVADVTVETSAPATSTEEQSVTAAPENAAEKPQPKEVVSVVVTGADENTAEEDGAPKALLQIEQVETEPASETAPETASETAPEPAPTAETEPITTTESAAKPEAATETPEEDGFISFEDEEDNSELSAEALAGE